MRDQNLLKKGPGFFALSGITALMAVLLLAFAPTPASAAGSSFFDSIGEYLGFAAEKTESTVTSDDPPFKFFRRAWLRKAGSDGLRSKVFMTKAMSPAQRARIEADEAALHEPAIVFPLMPLTPLANLLIYTYSPELDSLYRFNSDTPGIVTAIPLTGIDSINLEILEFIDFSPKNGLLYAVAVHPSTGVSRVVTVNTATGQVSTAGAVPMVSAAFYGGDFNPGADQIREVGRPSANRRLGPAGGVAGSDTDLAYASGDSGFGMTPNVVHIANSNNYVGSTSTTVYGIDTNRDVLVTIGSPGGSPVSPNTGQLFTVGPLGINATSFGGFDIHSGTNLAYAALTVSGVPYLYSINLSTGAASQIGEIGVGGSRIDGLSIAPGVAASANLSITKTDNSTTYLPGSTRPYTIVVSNAGPDPVAGATVTDTLTSQFSAATWTCTGTGGGTCPSSGTGSLNVFVNLPAGATVTFNFQATVALSTSGNLSNTATVAAPTGVLDTNLGNNTATDINAQSTPLSTPTPTPTPTPTSTPTPTPAVTPTPIASPTPSVRTNYALSANGGIATASTAQGPPTAANDGSRVWAFGSAWKDDTPGVFPDTLEIAFNGPKSIDEISIFAVRDDFLNTTPPDETTTTTTYSLVNLQVQYWSGSAWVTIPGGLISGNNKAWKKIVFSPITTTMIRLVVNQASLDGYTRVVELEAWGGTAVPAPSPTQSPTPTPSPSVQPSPSPSVMPLPSPSPSVQPTPAQRANYALAANGGVASASTELNPASNANDGSRAWAVGGAWKDASPNAFPDLLQVDFAGTEIIDEISVFAVRDDFTNTSPPDANTATSLYSLISFEAQYWNGTSWVTVSGGAINGNNKAWVKIVFSPVSTNAVRVRVNNAAVDGYSRIVELEAWGGGDPGPIPTPTPTPTPPVVRTNHALGVNGGTAAGTTELNPASNAIDGSRVWAVGGAWKDDSPGIFPDVITVTFNGTKSIDEVSVFAVKDDFLSSALPDMTTTTSLYSLADFEIQYWNGSAWVTIPGGVITGNNKVWKTITFTSISTTRIRVIVNSASQDGFSRIVELETWGNGPPS